MTATAEHELERPLRAVRAGTLSFNKFAIQHNEYWQRLAGNIWRRWDKPTWVGSNDVHQELLFNAWLYIPRSRDVDKPEWPSLAHFVIWHSVNRTQKKLQAIRMGGKRPHRDKDENGQSLKSRYEIPFSSFITEDEDEEIRPLRSFGRPADQHKRVERKQILTRAASNANELSDKLAFAALAINDAAVAEAASVLYDNNSIRLMFRLDNERDAVRMVVAALERQIIK